MSNDLFYFYILFWTIWTRQVHERRVLQGQQPEGLVWLLGLCRVNGQASGNTITESGRRCMNDEWEGQVKATSWRFLFSHESWHLCWWGHSLPTTWPPGRCLRSPLNLHRDCVTLLGFVLGQKKKNYLTQDLKRKVKIEKNILIFYFLKNNFYWLWKKGKKILI